MCDYSLMAIPNRLAAKGEQIAAHRFRSGTIGLVSLEEFKTWRAGRPVRLWERIKDCFSTAPHPSNQTEHVFLGCSKTGHDDPSGSGFALMSLCSSLASTGRL